MKRHFSKKHYEAIARIIVSLDMSGDEYDHVVETFTKTLLKDNNRFDASRFTKACYAGS